MLLQFYNFNANLNQVLNDTHDNYEVNLKLIYCLIRVKILQ